MSDWNVRQQWSRESRRNTLLFHFAKIDLLGVLGVFCRYEMKSENMS